LIGRGNFLVKGFFRTFEKQERLDFFLFLSLADFWGSTGFRVIVFGNSGDHAEDTAFQNPEKMLI